MGAHPSAPSGVERGGQHTTLDAVIAAGPEAELGRQVAERFGGRLPFLLKVLAASSALSIQVHPSRAQAEAGYRAEAERGLVPGDKSRNYVDDWPKPEILCALTRFEVLAGMRDPVDAAALLRTLGVAALAPFAAELDEAASRDIAASRDNAVAAKTGDADGGDLTAGGGDSSRKTLGGLLASILGWPADGRQRLIGEVVAACEQVAAGSGPYAQACAAIVRIAADHPGDLGIVASLLLRYGVLEPGEAVFLPAGGLHAYLRGTGVELLANSDNVVRAGLTGKHIDIPELLRLTDPVVRVPLLLPRDLGDGIGVYDSPAPEFRLYRASLGAREVTVPGDGPRLVFVVAGTLRVRDAAGETLKIGRGESAFLSYSDGVATATGPAEAFIATVG
jgi:mannose-6-phosphate isomerase